MVVGVLALQGGFDAHAKILRSLGAEVREVRTPADLDGLDGLVMPGGESTTMTLGVEREGLAEPLRSFDRPIFGTCAGMIMLDRDHLGILDVRTERNAFGRQVHSFEADLEVLATVDGHPVAVRQGNLLAVSFHPELAGDTALHARFLDAVRGRSVAG